MTPQSVTPQSARPRRLSRGFTLIEMLTVIVILAILIAFLVPALQGALTRARVVQVKADISALQSAISQFKADFTIEPPSGIILFENAANWATPPTGVSGADVARSKAFIRQMWPQFDFTANHDVNSDGDTTDSVNLGGAECLVFFLGGVPQWTDSNANSQRDPGEVFFTGFSKNPLNPFASGGNRQGPYFEFVISRLALSPNAAFGPSNSFNNEGFAAYRDPLPNQSKPYVYLSSYDGKGYRLADLGTGGLQHWYLQGANESSPAWSQTKYQIISPGVDQDYGVGGPFQPTATTPLPGWTRTSTPLTPPTITATMRAAEQDNITSFHTGRLADR